MGDFELVPECLAGDADRTDELLATLRGLAQNYPSCGRIVEEFDAAASPFEKREATRGAPHPLQLHGVLNILNVTPTRPRSDLMSATQPRLSREELARLGGVARQRLLGHVDWVEKANQGEET